MGKKIFASYTSDRGLITSFYKKLKKLNTQRINDSMKKWANKLNGNFSKEKNTNGQKTYVEICNISGHRGNTNQKHIRIPPHSC
jgi:hypothetical protein